MVRFLIFLILTANIVGFFQVNAAGVFGSVTQSVLTHTHERHSHDEQTAHEDSETSSHENQNRPHSHEFLVSSPNVFIPQNYIQLTGSPCLEAATQFAIDGDEQSPQHPSLNSIFRPPIV
jgi:hypothetical protein